MTPYMMSIDPINKTMKSIMEYKTKPLKFIIHITQAKVKYALNWRQPQQ